jgi:hypothetical protein
VLAGGELYLRGLGGLRWWSGRQRDVGIERRLESREGSLGGRWRWMAAVA